MKLIMSLVVAAGVLSGVVSSVVSARMLERRHDEPSSTGSSPADASVTPALPAPATMEARAAASLARHQAAIDAHWREPVDPFWAKEAESSFASGLSTVKATANAEFDRLDCRSKTCVADLHFQSYEAERKGFLAFLTQGYGRKCGKALYGPVPADPSAPYTATIVFDCSAEPDAGAAPSAASP